MDGNDYPEVDGNDPEHILIWRFDESIPCECNRQTVDQNGKSDICPDCKGLGRRLKTWTERIIKPVSSK
jgi:excinuclease UvrABC ATPase subunit